MTQSAHIRWRRLYEAALLEVDQELLPRRVRIAKMAIHSQVVKLHKVNDAGGVWALMDALHVLEDLLKINDLKMKRYGTAQTGLGSSAAWGKRGDAPALPPSPKVSTSGT